MPSKFIRLRWIESLVNMKSISKIAAISKNGYWIFFEETLLSNAQQRHSASYPHKLVLNVPVFKFDCIPSRTRIAQLNREQSHLTLNAGYGLQVIVIAMSDSLCGVKIAREIRRLCIAGQAVHGYQLEHVVLAWCENDSDARWISFKLFSR